MDTLTWFVVIFVQSNCPASASCPATPHPVTIEMPSRDVCKQVQDLNADKEALECWGKPK